MKRCVFSKIMSMTLLLTFTVAAMLIRPIPISAEINRIFGESIDLGAPIQSIATIDASYGIEDGSNIMYTTVSSNPAKFNVVNLDEQKLLRTYELNGSANAWSHLTDMNGNVYIGASNKLFKYSPVTKTVEDLGEPIPGNSIWGLTRDDSGNIYGGVYPSGTVFKFDPVKKSFSNYGRIDDGTAQGDDGKAENYVRSIASYKGYIYAGTGTLNGRVWRLNPETGEKQRIELPLPKDRAEYSGKYDSMGSVYGLKVVRNYLVAFFNGPMAICIYDLDKEEWLDTMIPNIKGIAASTDEFDGKCYVVSRDGNMYSFDLETYEVNKVMEYAVSLRASAKINLKNNPDFGDNTFVALNYDGKVILINFNTGKKQVLEAMVNGEPNSIQSVEKGPDGKLYLSAYMGTTGAQIDPVTLNKKTFSIGQVEGMGYLGDKMYFGVYPGAHIHELDTTKPELEAPKIFEIPDEQDRPFVVASGGGKVFIGTISDYAKHGGALTVYDPSVSPATFESYRNVVQDQSIVGLAYMDGKIYGSTTVWGGLGADPIAKSAKMFVWDVNKKEKVKEFDLNIPGLENPIMISGLSFGPDNLLWGAVNGIIFAMDPNTLEVVKYKNIYPDVKSYGRWRPIYQKWGKDGLLYSNLAGRLTVIDPDTLEFKDLKVDSSIMALDDNGNIYHVRSSNLYMIPVSDPGELNLTVPDHVNEGDEFEVVISVTKFQGLYGADAFINFDPSKLQLVSVRGAGSFAGENAIFDYNNKDGRIEIMATQTGDNVVNEKTELAIIRFRALEETKEATITIDKESQLALLNADKTGNLYNMESDKSAVVRFFALEDVNKDGNVDSSDVAAVANNIMKPVSEHTAIYDINKDGKIDAADLRLVILKRKMLK